MSLATALLLVGAGLTGPAPTSAQSPLEPDDEFEHFVNVPVIYLPSIPSQMLFFSNYQGNDDIYTMNPDGTNLVNISHSQYSEKAPAWGPGQTMVVFQSNRSGANEIYTMNANGSMDPSQWNRLTNNTCDDIAPAWSQVTNRIVWSSNCNTGGGSDYEIWAMDSNGNNKAQLTNDADGDARPRWSPVANKVAFVSGNTSIVIMNGDGSSPAPLALPHFGSDPDWSPDGQTIVYTCTISSNKELCSIPAAGGSHTQLTTLPSSVEFSPAWSPTGQTIVLLSSKDEDQYNIYTMTVAVNAPLFRVPSEAILPAGFTEGSPDW